MTVVVLVDFHGHSTTGNEEMNSSRYSALKMLAFNGDDKPVIFVCNTYPNEDRGAALIELARMIKVDGKHKWYWVDPDDGSANIDNIKRIIEKDGNSIGNVIIGGCNLAGCVIHSKAISAIKWIKKGYNTEIFLPMCGEYQMPGKTNMDIVLNAFTHMYREIQKSGTGDKLELTSNFNELRIIQRIQR